MPEPDNHYDRNAVAVTIDQDTVGYLPREDAAAYAPLLQHLLAQRVLVSVPARVWWSADYGDGWMASVRLDLNPPGLLIPVNAPPTLGTAQLPPGSAIQVSGEDQHMNVLAPLVAAAGQVAALASLHEVTEEKARSSKQLIEVHINDRPVGRLTPGMSDHLLAAVRHAAAFGVTVYARASIRGNALKAEVTIYPTKAADLPQTWIDDLAGRANHPGRHGHEQAAAHVGSNGAVQLSVGPEHEPAPQLPPAGWYANPSGPGLRWWSGSTWTEHTHAQ